ncbi:hypothetical protein O3Q48_05665 [Enterococcus lactis]
MFNKHLGKSTFYVRAKHAIGLCEKVAAEINREIQSYHYEIGAPAEALEKIVSEELVQKISSFSSATDMKKNQQS